MTLNAAGRLLDARSPAPTRDMIRIEAGSFIMGSDRHYPEERPAHRVAVNGFWIDRHLVTNRQFAAFIAATGHITFAELAPKAEDYPDAPPENLRAGSLVFTPTLGPVPLDQPDRWWAYVHGADWRHPTGPESSIDRLEDHPVVHVAWVDAQAYAAWAEVELPAEKEWEFAARGGLESAEFAWGDEFEPNGRPQANTWQGAFPFANNSADGWIRTSPVGAYPPNGFGLSDMIGNVWEWTSDWWSENGGKNVHASCCTARRLASIASCDPCRIPRRVFKGGSHLCAPSYCRRYRPASRHPHPVDTSTSHIGFRCIARLPRARR
jgi:formylglycine-generating enzyme